MPVVVGEILAEIIISN